MDACDLTCLNPLELKNKRLKQILPERDLDIEILKKIKPKNGALGGKARATGRHADTWLESALACRLIRLSRATASDTVRLPAREMDPYLAAMRDLSPLSAQWVWSEPYFSVAPGFQLRGACTQR